ncbi:hypothetical protein RhiJN_21207 [Ceratobasidium sp. AG-Ba]|nr:hypothetical protein RhiJN_21207 [Ceratobasidium sp. AG-Ba]
MVSRSGWRTRPLAHPLQASPPLPPVIPAEPARPSSRTNAHGVKRKRQTAAHSTGSQDTLKLIERLERGLEARVPARKSKNKRVSSASAVLLGPSASSSSSTSMPPPRLKIPKSSNASPATITTPLSDVSTLHDESVDSPLASTSHIGSTYGSSSSSTTAPRPCTPPPRPTSRPASVPTLPASSLISPEHERDEEELQEETEPPPSPPRLVSRAKTPTPVHDHTPTPAPLPAPQPSPPAPVRINTSMFSVRSDSTESNKTATTVVDSPITSGASLPIIDLTLTPTPSPPPKPPTEANIEEKVSDTRITQKVPETNAARARSLSRASSGPGPSSSRQGVPARPPPMATHSEPSPPKPKPPRQPPSRAQTIPTTSQGPSESDSRASPEISTRAPSETESTSSQTTAPRMFSQSQSKPATQYPRVFASSQTRLGMRFMGKGYDAISKPFKVPNKNGVSTPLTVSALPRRGSGSGAVTGKAGGSGGKGAGKGKAKSPAGASTGGAGKLNFAPIAKVAPVPPAGGGGGGRKTPTPVGRPSTSARTSAPSKKRQKEPSSDTDSYLESDTSLDGAELEAAMAQWDNA